ARKALTDAQAFAEVVRAAGAELVLHGHMHMASLGHIGDTPVIGVPSASRCAGTARMPRPTTSIGSRAPTAGGNWPLKSVG
ncbi:MAG: hypothetical protein HC861_02775, partial [Rhodospirillaceae bacterium]|nr:hypothetical protein [Rhodospirillaceae bacterium]